MHGSHTDLSKTSSKSVECTCVANMLLAAFAMLIAQYQTSKQLKTEFRTLREKHPRVDERNTSSDTRNLKNANIYDYCVFVLETRMDRHGFDH